MSFQSLLYSKVTQFYTDIRYFFNILFHYGLPQEIGYSSLCYTVGPWCLSILNVIVCINLIFLIDQKVHDMELLGKKKKRERERESLGFEFYALCVVFILFPRRGNGLIRIM